MDFMSRNSGNAQTGPQGPAQNHKTNAGPKHFDWNGRAVRIEWFIFTLLVSIVLLFAIGWSIFTGSTPNSEYKKVDTTKYQAIFLNGGSTNGAVDYTTYFGHISRISDKYFVLKDIYYLTTTTSTDNKTVTPQLTKLGCLQLHSPYDEMIISRSQVAFWENLQDSGKVVTAIGEYIKQNPKGPDCTTASSSSAQSTTSAQSSAATSTPKSTP